MNPLWPLFALLLIIGLLSFLLFWLIGHLLRQNLRLESQKNQQVQDLLNRLMTKEWTSYQALNSFQSHQIPLQDGEGVGLSEENEMKKLADLLGQGYPTGEVLVETGLDEYDRHELGLDLP
jgi:hypothetical protein